MADEEQAMAPDPAPARQGRAGGLAFRLLRAAAWVLAVLVAIPVLRLQTHYFALATLLIGQVALLVATQWQSVTGGANGIGASTVRFLHKAGASVVFGDLAVKDGEALVSSLGSPSSITFLRRDVTK